MPIYLIETDEFFQPRDPVAGWYGPINPEIAVDWIANEEDCNGEFKIVPEIEFPTQRHYRRDDWLCVGVRPPRAMPRGLRLYLQPDNASGNEPPGLINSGVLCYHPDPANAPADVADYTGTSPDVPACSWRFSSDVDAHATAADPLAYDDDDFVLESIALYTASDGTGWRLLVGPTNYQGQAPLAAVPIPALGIARRRLGTPVDKTRSIVLSDPIKSQCGTGAYLPPADIQTVLGRNEIIELVPGDNSLEFTVLELEGNCGLWIFEFLTFIEDSTKRVNLLIEGTNEEPFGCFWRFTTNVAGGVTVQGPRAAANDVHRLTLFDALQGSRLEWELNGNVLASIEPWGDVNACAQFRPIMIDFVALEISAVRFRVS